MHSDTSFLSKPYIIFPAIFIGIYVWCYICSELEKGKAEKESRKVLNAPCPHGIAGGIVRDLCSECRKERLEAEVRHKKFKEQQEWLNLIETSARELQHKEATRVSKLLMPSLEELRQLSPQDFEDYVANLFRGLGYTVTQTPYTNDSGRDAILLKDGQKYLLECKRYKDDGSSGRPDLQKFHSAIISDGAIKGFFVTTGRFTQEAIEFSSKAKIELVDGKVLRQFFFLESNATANLSYQAMCLKCGEIVLHELGKQDVRLCKNRHCVEATLNSEKVLLSASEHFSVKSKRQK